MMVDARLLKESLVASLFHEGREITAVVVSSINTVRQNLEPTAKRAKRTPAETTDGAPK
jgi:hypothetical protein